MSRLRFYLGSLSLALCVVLFGAPLAMGAVEFPTPRDFDQVDIYLLTVGNGNQVYSRFGHTIVRVVDRNVRGGDWNFNWGTFDASEPGFVFRFFRGILPYTLSVTNFTRVVASYRDFEKRPVWQDRMVLTNVQKAQLVALIQENLKPENITYPYQYFFKNCATIPRDYFDTVLGGQFKPRFENEILPYQHRYWVRRNLVFNPAIEFGLDIMMNGDIDRPLSKWDEMFLPVKLREFMSELPAFDDTGAPIPGSKLLVESQTIVDLPEHAGDMPSGYLFAMLLLGAPVLAGIGVLKGRMAELSSSRSAIRLFGFSLGLWGVLAGLFGTVHVGAWLFSAHTDLHHNANLWLFWPTDALYAWCGAVMLFRARLPNMAQRCAPFLRTYAVLHAVGAVTLVIGWVTGLIAQDVSRIVLLLVPVGVVLSWLLVIGAVSRGGTQRGTAA